MNTGELIRKFRNDIGYSQRELGEKCIPRIAESTIRKYELGLLNPKLETIRRIADALNIPFGYLLELSDIVNQSAKILQGFNPNLDSEATTDENKKSSVESTDNPLGQFATIAAHFDGEEFTEEQLERIREFAEFIKTH